LFVVGTHGLCLCLVEVTSPGPFSREPRLGILLILIYVYLLFSLGIFIKFIKIDILSCYEMAPVIFYICVGKRLEIVLQSMYSTTASN
jgi:hypothetical protein